VELGIREPVVNLSSASYATQRQLHMVMLRVRLCIGLIVLAVLAGCSGGSGSRIQSPSFSGSSAAKKALEAFDKNGDGLLDDAELAASPGLLVAKSAIDTNRDGKLSADEIAARVNSYRSSGIGLMSIVCSVTRDGQPLSGATVRFVPEPFLADVIQSAEGKTERDGSVELRADGMALPGIQLGLYRVEVSLRNSKGSETIPEKYNSRTTLGQEISGDMRETVANIKLSSR
jgi:hypothetical protein